MVLYSLLSIGDLQQSLVFTVLKLVFCFTTKNYRLVLQHRIQCFFFYNVDFNAVVVFQQLIKICVGLFY